MTSPFQERFWPSEDSFVSVSDNVLSQCVAETASVLTVILVCLELDSFISPRWK